MNSKPVSDNLIAATHNLWNASSDINWIVGRLGVRTSSTAYDIDVVGMAGIVYVSLGSDGTLGQATASDAVGVAKVGGQQIRMRRENGVLVIREAEQYAAGSGGGSSGSGATTLNDLTDVTLSSPLNGQVLTYDAASGHWINAAGGGGASYTAGEAIDINGSNVISVKRYGAGAVGVISGALSVNVADGIQILSNALALNFSSAPGLEYGSGADAGKVQVKVTDGIWRLGAGIGVKLKTPSGLEVDSAGLALNDTIAGAGLGISGKILAVNVGDGLDIIADAVAVDVTDFIDTTQGLKEDLANNIQLKLDGDSSMQFGAAGGLQLGAPTTLSVTSINQVIGATHSHAITTSADVGTTPAQRILASTTGGALTLAQLTLVGNLNFTGGNRTINASNSLTIAPTTDLILDPGGLVLAPNAQDIRTVTINDLPTGIDGFRIWNRYANYTQLTIGAIKADELYVRVFVADETRIDRGEEYWSKSFGIVQQDFTLPAVGATADVWFEDAPAAVTFNLFSVNDYLLMRTIDWGTGLVVQKVWWQVTAGKLAQETTAVNGVDRQQWRIQRIQGGVNGSLIKRGNLFLDAGIVGQGWVHLSALSQDGGPFIQVGAMTSISTVPQFTNYARFGRLNGTVDYGSSPEAYGMAAGSGSGGIGTTPSGGFSGFTVDAGLGLRLFNTEIQIYNATVLELVISKTYGLRMLEADTAVVANRKYIGWFTNPVDATLSSMTAHLTSASVIGSGAHLVRLVKNAHNTLADANGIILLLQTNSPTSTTATGPNIQINRSGAGATNISLASVDDIFLTSTRIIASGALGVGGAPAASSILDVKQGTNKHIGIYTTGNLRLTTWNDAVSASVPLEIDGSQLILQAYGGKVGVGGAPVSKLHVYTTTDPSGGSGDQTNMVDALLTLEQAGTLYPLIIHKAAHASVGAVYSYQTGKFVYWGQDTDTGSYVFRGRKLGVGGAPVSKLHVYTTTDPSGGSGDSTNTVDASLTLEQAGTLYPVIIHKAAHAGVGAVYAYQTGKNVYWGQDTDTGSYVFRGRKLGVGTTPLQPLHVRVGANQNLWFLTQSSNPRILSINDAGNASLPLYVDGLELYLQAFGGAVGIGTATPTATETYSRLTVSASDASQVYAAVINTAGGQAGLVLNRTGTTPSRWVQYIPGGADRLEFYSGTLARAVLVLLADGQVRIGPDYGAVVSSVSVLQVGAQDTHVMRATQYGLPRYTLVGTRALGTAAAPSAIASGNIIMVIGALGYTNGGWSSGANGEISFRATEDYNGGITNKGGSEFVIFTRLNGATAGSQAARILHNGLFECPGVGGFNMGATGNPVYVRSDGLLGVQSSSLRYKRDIRPLPAALDDAFMMALEPVIYKSKPPVMDGVLSLQDESDYIGLIAEQTLAAGGHGFVGYDNEGLPQSLRYDLLTVPIIAALQLLIPYKRRVMDLEARMAELERRLRSQ